jgi:hypothetical protein
MDLEEDESEGSSRERVFNKKSKGGKKSGMKARWNASRTPGEEANII